jgi:hypothetical protein
MKGVFLLAKDPANSCRDIIYHRESGLRLHVYCLNKTGFEPHPDELQFYADTNNGILAFETWRYDIDDPALIIDAIRWYARYIDQPDLEILAEDPRPSQDKASYS